MSISVQNKKADINHFEALFEYASLGIVVADSSGDIKAVNPFALKEFGYTKTELLGKKIEILIPSRFEHKHIHLRENYTGELQCRPIGVGLHLFAIKKGGTEIPVEISLGNYTSQGEKYVIAFIKNIELRKKAQDEIEALRAGLEIIVQKRTEALNKTLEQLEIAKKRLEKAISFQKAILDNAGAMIIATDKNGMIKLFNPEASRNLGYHESEAIDKMTPMMLHDRSEIDRKRKELYKEFGILIEHDFDVMVEKSRRNIHEEQQYHYIRKDGTTFPVSLTITAMHDRKGEIIGYMGISFDISEWKKTETELISSLEREKELSDLKSRFVSMASHEFRTPLSTILSSAYLIEKYTKTADQPQRKKHLQRVESSVGMLTDILNDFLSVGKIEEGKIQVRFTRFNIQELIASIKGEFKNILKKQQKIKYKHTGSPDVYLDASLLKHIIMNLVSNAAKFSPEKSPIEIRTINSDQQCILSVKDYGMGISAEDQKHLMERFFRGANAGNIQGTGLGLHIVSKYAELMNGMVTCTSELEKGAMFSITFNTKNQ